MSKYKIVGSINFILGLIELIIPSGFYFFVFPEFQSLNSEFNFAPSHTMTYLGLTLTILISLVNFFAASKLFSKSKETQVKYLDFGLIAIVATFILPPIFMLLTTMPLILSIYDLK